MQTVSFAGSSYSIPNTRGDRPWSGLSDFVIAAASKAINTAGGNFTLLADINFGATFGLVSTYYKSRTANVASAGQIRLANTDTIKWRNGANGADLTLDINSDNLRFAATKILLSGAVVNADINAAAAIAYSKLNLATSIVNADISASAAIAYSKLNLATSIVNADISASAAIAYSKLNLTGLIVNADVGAAAAIALSKLAAVTASRALVSDGSGFVAAHASTTATEIGFVNGVTSAIQTQINTKAADSAVVHNTGTENVAGAKTFTTQLIGKGTATNDSPAAGYIGEYVESVVGSTNFPATGVYGDLTSISLTAGDWDVTAIMRTNIAGFATTTDVEIGISTTSGNSSTGLVDGSNYLFWAGGFTDVQMRVFPMDIPIYRLSLSGTTTVYFKFLCIYSAGTPAVGGARLSARRVR